jgi:hypothetical protein
LPPQPAEACRFADALKPLGISDNIKAALESIIER